MFDMFNSKFLKQQHIDEETTNILRKCCVFKIVIIKVLIIGYEYQE